MKIRIYLKSSTSDSAQEDIQKLIERLTDQQVCIRVVEEHTGIGYAQ